ncbi:MAG: squalene/phytoene synthase family protein [Ardenticatenaceae bacterium]|nr:squalene/phytoene synthase family protein [Anaerolineales bacterium]MCB8916584.1 squalene/phytoene synthase family protein [Ardenticatenaceae bacterium]
MTLQTYDWESPLLSLAYKATRSDSLEGVTATHDQDLSRMAYRHCEELTSEHSRSFYLASALLPRPKRQAIRAFYAFCRTTDDIVDYPADDTQTRLDDWRRRALTSAHAPDDLVPVAWSDTCTRYHIPKHYAYQFIDGVARDLHQARYETFAELAEYCYGVASTVGLISMHIVGFHTEQAIPYAIRLGVALQITNILRDVAEDWRRGRVYLPQEELRAFGLSEADIAAGVVTPQWREFMKFQIDRNRRLYREAWPGIAMLHREGRIAIGAAADFYSAILNDIEAHDYDIFSRRAHVTGWGKVRRIPGIWWRIRQPKSGTATKVAAANV